MFLQIEIKLLFKWLYTKMLFENTEVAAAFTDSCVVDLCRVLSIIVSSQNYI